MKRKILGPHYYPGTLEILRTAIGQLAPEGEWVSSSGARVGIFEYKWLPDGKPSPYYAEWALRLISADPKDRSRCATITAQQLQGELLPWGEPESVYVFEEGRDATWSLEEPRPMGKVLEDLHWAVFREVHWIVGRCTAQAEAQPTTPHRDDGSKPSGGRPPNAEDDWAYQEIEAGRDQTEVYKEWLEKIPDSRRSQLVDPLDSFKKAMRYRRKRGKKGKKGNNPYILPS